ncbi:MAG: alpha/beta hydrolase [Pseudomonadota bacterium]
MFILTSVLCVVPAAMAAPELERRLLEFDGRASVEVFEGRLAVPEVRSQSTSNTIELGFRILKAAPGATGDPVFVLAGGPGGSYNQTMEEGGLGYYGPVTPELFARTGDVVLLDLRGVYLSTPNLICDGPPFTLRSIKTESDYLQLSRDAAVACREKFVSNGIDPAGYTILEAAQDVIDLADALGYDQFAVYGASFGSFYAITLAKYHPDRISRLVISAVESLDDTIDDYAAVLEHVRAISALSTPVWQGAYGASGPLEAFEDLYASLAANPEAASGLTEFELSLSLMGGINFGLSSRDGMVNWPSAMGSLMEGDVFLRKLARWGLPFFIGRGNRAGVSGPFDCATNVSATRREYLDKTTPDIYKPYVAMFDAGCEAWQVARLPASYFDPFESDIPAWIFHGDLDTSTPMVNAQNALSLFPRASLTVIEGGSHGSFWEAASQIEGFDDAVVDWMITGKPLPESVSLPPVEFAPL